MINDGDGVLLCVTVSGSRYHTTLVVRIYRIDMNLIFI